MDPSDKGQLQWKYRLNKDRLTLKEQFLVSMVLYADMNVGQIAKFTHNEAPVVKRKIENAIHKLW